jgi:hypothetical protein
MSTPREKALFGEALEIADPVQRRQFLDQPWSRRSLAWRNDMPVRTATARVILAMSLREDGESEAALSELEQARNILESGFDAGLKHGISDGGLWFDWVFARVLFHEASELLPAKRGSARGPAPCLVHPDRSHETIPPLRSPRARESSRRCRLCARRQRFVRPAAVSPERFGSACAGRPGAGDYRRTWPSEAGAPRGARRSSRRRPGSAAATI